MSSCATAGKPFHWPLPDFFEERVNGFRGEAIGG
jgi:hypothetical protein